MEAYLDNSATTRAYPEVGDLVYKVMFIIMTVVRHRIHSLRMLLME